MSQADGSSEQGRAPSGRRRGRRRGLEVRPGSVKQARMEAGLSLGQVAQGDISRTAIYFVETGKAKPSLETLQLIAQRTSKPLEYFLGDAVGLSDEAALGQLERLVAIGDNAGAVAAGDAMLTRTSDGRNAAHARMLLAIAHVRLAQPVRARSHASAARAYFERTQDVLMTAESMSWEAASAMLMQDPVALDLAEDALARCRSLNPVPNTTEAKLLAIVGHVRNARHEYAKAIQAYEEAVAVGSSLQDLRRLSYVYGNLSLAYSETGQYGQAAHYAHRAMALYETLHDRLSLAWAKNNLALLVFKQGDLAAALRHAESSITLIEELGVEAGKAHVLMTLCELELARSNHDEATRHASAALEVAERLGETTNVGEAHVWLGSIAAAQNDAAAADEEFAIAFERFDLAEAVDWQARGHAVYAEILEARGNLVGANRELRLALAAVGTRTGSVEGARFAIA